MSAMNIHEWFSRVSRAKDRQELFAILDEFRPLQWTDGERSQMARLYIRLVDDLPDGKNAALPAGGKDESEADNVEADDGPVWYEKM